jgi:hypothetical protein
MIEFCHLIYRKKTPGYHGPYAVHGMTGGQAGCGGVDASKNNDEDDDDDDNDDDDNDDEDDDEDNSDRVLDAATRARLAAEQPIASALPYVLLVVVQSPIETIFFFFAFTTSKIQT